MADHVIVWDKCLSTIRERVDEKTFQTWFMPMKCVRYEKHSLTLQVPNRFFYEYVEEHFVPHLKAAIQKHIGPQGGLEYQILMPESASRSVRREEADDDLSTVITNRGEKIKNPFVIPGIKKVKIDPQLNAKYRFDNYIEGDFNKLARSAGLAIAKNPGKTAFNPLFIFGDVGLGKTHLAQGIGNQVLQAHKNKVVLYVTSEKFTSQIIQAIKSGAIDDFVNFYQLVDVLIVDDIQQLAGRKKTLEIFFNIFNNLHQKGKQIIITSDRPPKDLQDMEDRLISRFKWGLSADLGRPDFETRIAILEGKMQAEGVELPRDIVEYICYNIKSNIRELEGVLISLIAQSSLNGRKIDLDLTSEVVENFIHYVSREISIPNIVNLVAEHYEIDSEKVTGKSRKREYVVARQLAMFLSKKLTDESLKSIGAHFSGRDHTTVIYSVKAVQDMIDTDDQIKESLEAIEKKIKLSAA